MTDLTLPTPECFKPLDQPSRYKAAHGGRGSGKSWHFASMIVEHCLLNPGSKVVCIREVQKTLNQSAEALIESKIQELGVGSQFRVLFEPIETPGGGLIIFQGMRDQNAESIKSLEGYNIAWVEEAQTLSARSLALLRPTIRADEARFGSPGTPAGSRMPLMSSCAVRSPTTQSSSKPTSQTTRSSPLCLRRRCSSTGSVILIASNISGVVITPRHSRALIMRAC